jgi:hypothetical protein
VTATRADAGDAGSRDERWWLAGLVILLVGAAPLLLWFGRAQSFFLDEWVFLVDRELTDLDGLLQPHNGHWVTVPFVAYRVNFQLFGIRSYVPYQVLVVLAHLGVAFLLWLVARRLGARPSIAAVAAAVFAFLGSGADNIWFAFQVSLDLSILCGLAHLLLADHDGPLDGRDVAGIVLGVVGLMSSAIGVPMVAGVGLSVLLRRGWRIAAVHVGVPALVYLTWYVLYGGTGNDVFTFRPAALRFAWRMVHSAFVGLGQNRIVAVLIGALAVAGLAAALRRARVPAGRAAAALPVALVACCVLFTTLTGVSRAGVTAANQAEAGRYRYVVVALLLPLVALGGEALARRARFLVLVPIALLALGVPGNLDLLRDGPARFAAGNPDLYRAAAHSDLIDQVPARFRLDEGFVGIGPTVAWLRRGVETDRIPAPGPGVPASVRLTADGRLALRQQREDEGLDPCARRRETVRARLERGDRLAFSGTVVVTVVHGRDRSSPFSYDGGTRSAIAAVAGPIDVLVTGPLGGPPTVC